ncbi:MAG TPA: transcription elongation factor GreA [Anaerolineae bacterium]|nr:transcription elongation factor GreA [Anaerolineae bacterium]
MSEQSTYLTREGLKKLQDELEYLKTVKRQEVADRLHAAMDEGDIDENAEYDEAKNEQAFVEGRILTLETMLKNYVLIEDHARDSEEVSLGSTVTVVEGDNPQEKYHIVGAAEADPTRGRISNESPLGRALLGRRVGDTVQVSAPAGLLTFRILKIG